MRREEEDTEGRISGGRFVEPAANLVLPPVRRATLQGGRFVEPAANEVLPPPRSYALQMEPGADPPFHMGKRYSVNAISTITPGTGSYIKNIKFLYPANTSNVVTSVPAGEQFDFIVDYRCQNTSGNLIDPWSMCIVWWELSDGPGLPTPAAFTLNGYYWKNTSLSLAPTLIDDNQARLNNQNPYLIMPARNIVLRFNMFANDDATPSQRYPDPSAWQQLV